jgi:3-deoxy-manno-octulosonate cytidylyltransferase (CMP-KDO synthetase)
MASTRFPGKVLAAETGRPLVQHVVDRVRQCRLVDEVIVAADDERIAAALRPYGTRVELTRPDHPSGTDRVAEVARGLEAQIVVNVQGDEPEIEPAAVDVLIELMRRSPWAEMATLATPFPRGEDPGDPNLVKVVVGRDGRALYFSRSPIPHARDDAGAERVAPLLHIGLYGYRRPFLQKLAEYRPTPLEETEKLEQLRVLEYGHTIVVGVVDRRSHGIDTPRQYAEFVKREKARIAQRGPETAPAAETGGPSET